MATAKVKSMSKADWQKLAKKYKVEFTPKNTVRYLVEKIAELNGVDDKIVSLDELKQQTFDAISKPKKKSTAKKKKDTKKTTKKTAKKTAKKTTKKKAPKLSDEEYAELERQHYQNECARLGVNYGADQNANDMKQILDYHCKQNPHCTYEIFGDNGKQSEQVSNNESPTLESLKAECDKLGLAYTSIHTVDDLTNLLNAYKGQVGNVHNHPLTNNDTPEVITSNAPLNQQPSLITNPSSPIAPNPTEVDMKQLEIYHDVFINTINNHFRLLTLSEVYEMLNSGEYPFEYSVNTNPQSENQIYITLSSGDNTKRVPTEGWINING